MMKLGFTGTRHGMTPEQEYTVAKLISLLGPTEAHHGDCVGADGQFHDLIRTGTDAKVIIHPPTNSKVRAYRTATYTREPKDYLERDRAIVDETDALIAAPYTSQEEQRSGTWYTVRYARKQGKMLFLVLPWGEVQCEPGETRSIADIRAELQADEEQSSYNAA